jgi:hypothetical protein
LTDLVRTPQYLQWSGIGARATLSPGRPIDQRNIRLGQAHGQGVLSFLGRLRHATRSINAIRMTWQITAHAVSQGMGVQFLSAWVSGTYQAWVSGIHHGIYHLRLL